MKLDQCSIQKAVKEDAKDILALQKLAYMGEAERYGDFNIPPLLQTLEEIEAEFSTHIFLKAVFKSRIIGSVRANNTGNTWYVGRLIVNPEYRGNGVGGALLDNIEEQTGHSGRYEIFTGSESLVSFNLYQKRGYHEFRRARLSEKVI
jgi:GNAT superfamily N-acetyltransferase